jgi:hypothetical protein
MYRKNDKHQQLPLISDLNRLPEKLRKRLEESWAGTFYRECFSRIDEESFAVLYSDQASRPNVPVNVLVGAETLKAGFGWSDEELSDRLSYDLQTRYAVGYRNLDEGHFELRTLYNFRRRLSEHMEETGENLLEQAFEQVSDEQIQRLKVKTGSLRMDSTQVTSNIRQMSRLQLLVEMLQRLEREMKEEERKRYAAEMEAYVKGSSGHYVYRVKPEEVDSRLQEIGSLMRRLVDELAEEYAENETYQLFKRVCEEHFIEENEEVRPRQGKEIPPGTLQSPDDPEATYRRAKGKRHKGYVANITETCDPDNDLQLIVAVQVEDARQDDAAMLADIMPNLQTRTGFDTLYTDGNYNSPSVDELMRQQQAAHIQTGIRGGHRDPERIGLEDFIWEKDEAGWPKQVTCPQGDCAVVVRNTEDHFVAHFNQTVCQDCPLRDACPTKPLKQSQRRRLDIRKRAFFSALRRQAKQALAATGRNPRAAVEATVRSVKHPFPNGKLPVRGKKRMTMMLIGSAAMTNIRRIWSYEWQIKQEQGKENPSCLSFLPCFRRNIFRFSFSWLNPAFVLAQA